MAVLGAHVGTAVFALLIVLQAALALGAPLGRLAWGGAHRVLPAGLRFGSLAAIVILALGIALLRAGAGLPSPVGGDWVRPALWGYAALFALSVLGNLASKSPIERATGTPLATLAVLSCLAVLSF